MTGDETNNDCNCHIVKSIKEVFPDVKVDPVASKAGEESELKPCEIDPMGKWCRAHQLAPSTCALHKMIYELEGTSNAKEKQIAALKQMYETQLKCIAALEARNAEMETELRRFYYADGTYEIFSRHEVIEKRKQAANKIADLEKRNLDEMNANIELHQRILLIEKRNKILEESKTTKEMLDDMKSLYGDLLAQAAMCYLERGAWREVALREANVCKRKNCPCRENLEAQFARMLKKQ